MSVTTVPDILARIVAEKQRELAAYPPLAELERKAAHRAPARDFAAALLANPPAIIAEVKKGSPSKGVFTEDFDAAKIAADYTAGGAAALSVLTDRKFFFGGWEYLHAARAAAPVPVLRKDFTIDERHVLEAAAEGADAILLIAAILSEGQMRSYRELAEACQMTALVEVHDEKELEAALASGAKVLGVNNRNLHTFTVSLETSLRLAAMIPANLVKVSESGIHSAADVAQLREAGYAAFLVGEHLMRSGNPAAALATLRGA